MALASQLPKSDAAEAYACSVDNFNNQRCTMIYTEDFEFPWVMFTGWLIFFAAVV